jgi:hypothetical protein
MEAADHADSKVSAMNTLRANGGGNHNFRKASFLEERPDAVDEGRP